MAQFKSCDVNFLIWIWQIIIYFLFDPSPSFFKQLIVTIIFASTAMINNNRGLFYSKLAKETNQRKYPIRENSHIAFDTFHIEPERFLINKKGWENQKRFPAKTFSNADDLHQRGGWFWLQILSLRTYVVQSGFSCFDGPTRRWSILNKNVLPWQQTTTRQLRYSFLAV